MKRLISIILVIVLISLIGCTAKDKQVIEKEKPVVYTSFYPLYYLAYEIGKDKIDLKIVVPNGVEPHDYEPTMKQIKDISQSDLFIYIGAGMEDWLDKLLSIIDKDKILLVNGSEQVKLINIENIPDPHIWLDPLNMDRIGKEIKDKLIELDSKNEKFYEENYLELSKKLNELNNLYLEVLKEKKIDMILVSHKAFSYLANRYDLKQISVTGITPNEEPGPKAIANLVKIAKREKLKYIFLETLASPKTVDTIAEEAGLETLTLNPVAGLTEEEQKKGYDYISIMEENLINLKKALVD